MIVSTRVGVLVLMYYQVFVFSPERLRGLYIGRVENLMLNDACLGPYTLEFYFNIFDPDQTELSF